MKIKRDPEDIKWSKLVRDRDGKCRVCGKTPPSKLDAHHIRPRGRSITRWDLSNGITLCVHHHVFGKDAIHNSINQEKWMTDIIGKKEWDRLEKLSNQYQSRDKARKEFLTKYKI